MICLIISAYVGSDLQSIKTIRDTLENKLFANREKTEKIGDFTNKNINTMHNELNEMREKLKNEISNLKEENHGC